MTQREHQALRQACARIEAGIEKLQDMPLVNGVNASQMLAARLELIGALCLLDGLLPEAERAAPYFPT